MSKALQSQSVPAGLTPAFPPGPPAGQSVIAITDAGQSALKVVLDTLNRWIAVERNITAMHAALAGIPSRKAEYDTLIQAGVACEAKVAFWRRAYEASK